MNSRRPNDNSGQLLGELARTNMQPKAAGLAFGCFLFLGSLMMVGVVTFGGGLHGLAEVRPGSGLLGILGEAAQSGHPSALQWTVLLGALLLLFGSLNLLHVVVRDSLHYVWKMKPREARGWKAEFPKMGLLLLSGLLLSGATFGGILLFAVGSTATAFLLTLAATFVASLLAFFLVSKGYFPAPTTGDKFWPSAAVSSLAFSLGATFLTWFYGSTQSALALVGSIPLVAAMLWYGANSWLWGVSNSRGRRAPLGRGRGDGAPRGGRSQGGASRRRPPRKRSDSQKKPLYTHSPRPRRGNKPPGNDGEGGGESRGPGPGGDQGS